MAIFFANFDLLQKFLVLCAEIIFGSAWLRRAVKNFITI